MRLLALLVLVFVGHLQAATLNGRRVTRLVDGDTLDVVVQGSRIRVRIRDIGCSGTRATLWAPFKEDTDCIVWG